MRLVVGATALVAVLAAVVLLWFDGPAEFTGYQVLLFFLAVMAMRRLRPAEEAGEDNAPLLLRIKRAGRPHHTTPPQLERIERLVAFGKTTAFDAEWRLLPFLRSIAAQLLEARHGVDPAARPDLARELLGDPAWDLLDPDRPLPVDRMAPGLSVEALDTAIYAIEEL
ncbi:MAG TPA: hypothetical protein VJ482_09835 [Acidimicrobiia bacterium]|nr:hypothetical protein [Acidimicrobiia bacterium]